MRTIYSQTQLAEIEAINDRNEPPLKTAETPGKQLQMPRYREAHSIAVERARRQRAYRNRRIKPSPTGTCNRVSPRSLATRVGDGARIMGRKVIVAAALFVNRMIIATIHTPLQTD